MISRKAARAVKQALDVVSTTSRGSAEIFVDFPWGSDMNQALLAVQAVFAQTLPDLPQGTSYEAIQMSPNTMLMPFVLVCAHFQHRVLPRHCVVWRSTRSRRG